jgi:hypothetical protein
VGVFFHPSVVVKLQPRATLPCLKPLLAWLTLVLQTGQSSNQPAAQLGCYFAACRAAITTSRSTALAVFLVMGRTFFCAPFANVRAQAANLFAEGAIARDGIS